MVQVPVPVGVGGDGCPLIGVRTQVKEPGNPCLHKGPAPDQHGPRLFLLGEDHLPVFETQCLQIAIIGKVEEFLTGPLLLLAGQVRHEIVAVQVHLKGLVARRVALLQFFFDLRVACNRQQSRQPV